MKFKPYKKYKDSRVEWLGEVPEHWNVKKGKFSLISKKELNKNLQCMERLSLTMKGVIDRSIISDNGLQPKGFDTYQLFKKGNLVFKLIDLDNFKISRVGFVHKNGIMSSAYIRLIAIKCDPKFFYYFYFKLYLEGVYNKIGQGIRSTLNSSELLELFVCTPNNDE